MSHTATITIELDELSNADLARILTPLCAAGGTEVRAGAVTPEGDASTPDGIATETLLRQLLADARELNRAAAETHAAHIKRIAELNDLVRELVLTCRSDWDRFQVAKAHARELGVL